MASGLLAASRAAWLVIFDLRYARLHDGSTRLELDTALWNVILWIGMAVVNCCLLLIGIQAMTLPAVPGRDTAVTFSGLCFIAAGVVLAATPIAYLLYRWYVLRQKEHEK